MTQPAGHPLDFSKLEPCDILVETNHGFFGFFAGLFGEPDQHAVLVSELISMGWESVANGVHKNLLSPHKPYIVLRVDGLPPEIQDKVLAAAKADEGRMYGYGDLIAYGLGKIVKKYVNIDFDLDRDNGPLFCSANIVRWFRAAGVDLVPGVETHLVTPAMLVASKLVTIVP